MIEAEATDAKVDRKIIKAWEEILGWTWLAGGLAYVANTLLLVILHFHMQAQKHRIPGYKMVGLHWYFYLPAMFIATLTCFVSFIALEPPEARYPIRAKFYVILCCVLSPLVLLAALNIYLWNKTYDKAVVPYKTKLDQRAFEKSLKDQGFSSELKQLYKQQSELALMAPSREQSIALKYVEASIETLRAVPQKIKRDEDRIKAMNIIDKAKELLIPAQTQLEAHNELMHEYHEPMLKQQLEQLNYKKELGDKSFD